MKGWMSILKLADKWGFARARKDAIKNLDDLILSPVLRIQLAREFCISGWQVPALEVLIVRKDALSLKDALLLGMEPVLGISDLREIYGPIATRLREERCTAKMSIYNSHVTRLRVMDAAYAEESTWVKKKKDDNSSYVAQSGAKQSSDDRRRSVKVNLAYNQFVSAIKEGQEGVIKEMNKIPQLTPAIVRAKFGLGDDS
jgi:hypothetical protein